jgi:8-amino-7-oxononanoate synthase
VDFASNDYLGLAESGVLADAARAALDRGVAVGSGGSRLLRGNHDEHEALEAEAAAFFGAEATLFLPTGYTANSALLATLPQKQDHIFADALIHASCHEGLRLSRAPHTLVPHNDVAAFEAAIAAWRAGGGTGRAWIVVESLYSMDGDIAPLAGLNALAHAQDAVLVVDEAHATGVFGPGGRGLVADLPERARILRSIRWARGWGVRGASGGPARDARVSGQPGAWLHLFHRALAFERRHRPRRPADQRAGRRSARRSDGAHRPCTGPAGAAGRLGHGTPVMPLILGSDGRAMAVAGRLQEAGFDIRGIRPHRARGHSASAHRHHAQCLGRADRRAGAKFEGGSVMKGLIVTGTDTEIGKTMFSASLTGALVRRYGAARYWKPVQAGLEEVTDSEAVQRLAPGARIHPEAYRLITPPRRIWPRGSTGWRSNLPA